MNWPLYSYMADSFLFGKVREYNKGLPLFEFRETSPDFEFSVQKF